MKLTKLAGSTSEIWQIFAQDSSSTTGGGLTGLVFNTASLTCYYHRDTDTTATAVTLVTMTSGTFTSSGFVVVDGTNMPGVYEFCPPNAAIASGAKSVVFYFKGATNLAPLVIEVQLTAVNPDSATAFITAVNGIAQTGDSFARLGAAGAGLTALGDTRIANLDAAVTTRMATYAQPTGFLAATFPTTVASPTNITAGIITTVTNLTNAPTAGDFTATMKTSLNAATPASVVGAVGSVTGNVGGNVVGSVASVTAVVSANLTKINGTTVNGNGGITPWGP